jgi:hypothetical protein
MMIAVNDGALIPFKGLVLDNYRPKTDDALLVVCENCKKWRIARGQASKVPGYNKNETHRRQVFCHCKEEI